MSKPLIGGILVFFEAKTVYYQIETDLFLHLIQSTPVAFESQTPDFPESFFNH